MSSVPVFNTLKLNLSENGVLTIAFDRPGGNAMSGELFEEWLKAINFADSSASVRVMVQTGTGKFYSSGKELAPTMHDDFEQNITRELKVLEALIDALINFSKPCIAAVNGPAIGLSVTSSALYDFVYAVPEATFSVPFMRWGFCAEGCSSYLFPKLMGKQIANDLLLAGSTLPVQRLADQGYLEILPKVDFMAEVTKRANILAGFDTHTVVVTRSLVQASQRTALMAINHEELRILKPMMMSMTSRKAIQDFIDQRAAKQLQRQKKKSSNL